MNIIFQMLAHRTIITVEQYVLEVLNVPACAMETRTLGKSRLGVQPGEVPSQGKLSVLAERCPGMGPICSDNAKHHLFNVKKLRPTSHLAKERPRRRTGAPPLTFGPFFEIHTAASTALGQQGILM